MYTLVFMYCMHKCVLKNAASPIVSMKYTYIDMVVRTLRTYNSTHIQHAYRDRKRVALSRCMHFVVSFCIRYLLLNKFIFLGSIRCDFSKCFPMLRIMRILSTTGHLYTFELNKISSSSAIRPFLLLRICFSFLFFSVLFFCLLPVDGLDTTTNRLLHYYVLVFTTTSSTTKMHSLCSFHSISFWCYV